jgi:hypothetical protein
MESGMLKSFVPAAFRVTLLAIFVSTAMQSAASAKDVFQLSRVPLTCFIEHEKIIAVVNSTGETLAGGTLRVDAMLVPSGQHFIRSRKIGQMPSGTVIRIGAARASSCSASVTIPRPVTRGE